MALEPCNRLQRPPNNPKFKCKAQTIDVVVVGPNFFLNFFRALCITDFGLGIAADSGADTKPGAVTGL